MPQKQKSSKKKLVIIIAAAVLLVGGGATAYTLYNNAKNKADAPRGMNDVDYSPATDTEKQEGEQHKTTDTTTPGAPSDQKPTTPTDGNQTPPSQTQTITVVVTRVNQSGQTVSIRANIEGTTTGTCHVTFARTGQSNVTKTFPVSFEATTSQCQGADIPVSDFPMGGTWSLSLTVTNGSQTSNTATGSVNVTK